MVNGVFVLLSIVLIGQIIHIFIFVKRRRKAEGALIKRQNELECLYFLIGHGVSDKFPITERLNYYLNRLKKQLGFTYHSIFRLDEEGQVLIIRFTGNLPKWYMDELSSTVLIRVGDLSVGRAVATKQPSTINAANFDPRFKSATSLTAQTGYRSLSCYPMIGTLKIYGGFCAYSIYENIFTLHNEQFFLTCSNIYAAILENTLLEKVNLDKGVKAEYVHNMNNNIKGSVEEKKKILIVEDDFYIREIYKTEAEYEGYVVLTADDGQEAIEKVKSERPDLVLLDVMLPKVDGITVLKTIKSDPQLKHIPCVILTNLEDEAKQEEARNLGAADYLLKIKKTPQAVISSLKKYF